GTAELRISPYDVRALKGFDLLRQFSGDAKLSWETPLADAFAELVDDDSVQIRRGDLDVAGEMRIERGVLSSGTRARADVHALDMKVSAVEARASAHSDFVVDEAGSLTGTIASENLRVEKSGAPPAACNSVLSTITSRHLDLAHGFDDAHVRLQARGVTTQSLERWIAPHDRDSAWATGTSELSGDLESGVAKPDFHGHVDVAIHDASLVAGPVRTMSPLEARIDFDHLSPEKKWIEARIEAHTPEPTLLVLGNLRVRGRLAAGGRIDAHLGKMKGEAKNVEISDAEVKCSDVRADLNAEPLFVAPEIAARTSRLALRGDHLEGSVEMDAPRVDLASLAALAALAPFPESTRVVGGTATASAHASVDLDTLAAEGNADLLARNVDVRIDKTPFYGNLRVAAHAVRRADGADF
ncbi:MAG: hypothetical protein ACREJX_08620, partial [Polyangiaceae bacterium]